MTEEVAIHLARTKKAQFLGLFGKLHPYAQKDGTRAVEYEMAPLVAWPISDPASFDRDLKAILADDGR